MFDFELARLALPLLFKAFGVTVTVTLLSYLLALVLGTLAAVARFGRPTVLSRVVDAAVEGVRGTPLLVQLYLLYYGLGAVGVRLDPLFAGVLGLGVHYAAYVAEIARAGIAAVPAGQWDAARAIGLSGPQIWQRVVLPQATRRSLAPLGNRLVAMFKETPLLAAITVPEVLLVAREFGSQHFSYLEPYTLVGGLFLVASLVASAGVTAIERRVRVD